MMALSQGREGAVEDIASKFVADELGAPFKVVLHNSVEVKKNKSTGEIESYRIPDMPQLLNVVLITRLAHSQKLSGADIKFCRKVLSLQQKVLAQKLDISPEHLSRCEKGATPLSPSLDKLLRVFAIKEVVKLPDMPKGEEKAKLEVMLDEIFDGLTVSPVHLVEDEVVLHFVRRKLSDEDGGSQPDGSGDWSGDVTGVAA